MIAITASSRRRSWTSLDVPRSGKARQYGRRQFLVHGNLAIDGSLKAPTVTLITAGELREGSAGAVTTTTKLNVTANTGIDLNSTHNHSAAVGTRHTNSGPNVINGIGM